MLQSPPARPSTSQPDRYLVLYHGSEFTKHKTLFYNLILFRAPTDCVQYFTGTAGSVQSYNHAGGQLLKSQRYTNCIRTEKGYCAIQWKQSSTSNPDPFGVGEATKISTNADPGATVGDGTCTLAYVLIPNLRKAVTQVTVNHNHCHIQHAVCSTLLA